MIATNEMTLQRYHSMSDSGYDSHLEDSRKNVDIPSLQLQFPTGTYNPDDSYVFQSSTKMDEDDEAGNEFTSGHSHV
ncbi:hypothetical protein Scep_009870 [Stephania cephalantha]|uniref:Uncharacterized protein n=1 Tax=Stephania cephalantha TaxID=152367 RepID=A0AAP0JUN0_9MAGN